MPYNSPGQGPWGDAKPEFRLLLTHPTSNRDHIDGRRSMLRITEEVSGQVVLELEMNANDLQDLLSNRETRPVARRIGPHPERWGHEMLLTSATYREEHQAREARDLLERNGWQVDEIRRNNTGRHVVTGRRWDGHADG